MGREQGAHQHAGAASPCIAGQHGSSVVTSQAPVLCRDMQPCPNSHPPPGQRADAGDPCSFGQEVGRSTRGEAPRLERTAVPGRCREPEALRGPGTTYTGTNNSRPHKDPKAAVEGGAGRSGPCCCGQERCWLSKPSMQASARSSKGPLAAPPPGPWSPTRDGPLSV